MHEAKINVIHYLLELMLFSTGVVCSCSFRKPSWLWLLVAIEMVQAEAAAVAETVAAWLYAK